MNKSRIMAAALSAVMLVSSAANGIQCFAQPVSASSSRSTTSVEISSIEDLREFSENCMLDSYSMNRTFVLTADLNIAGTGIQPIPSFSGTFDGNGHTISGMNISGKKSATGFFRYIEKTGVVKNLTVTGLVSPSGTAVKCGGIAGVNRGRILYCTFTGIVSGNEQCGGIAGVNEESGLIGKCTSNGRIQAEHYAGGIVGENDGQVRCCENNSSVNTNAKDPSIDLTNLEVSDLYSTESAADITDAGGIAGYSTGTIQSCVNRGEIGYPHIGYNIGGIAGRQDGYISSCENYGAINGRKDTGGIVGQAEPHYMISYSEELLDKLDTSLDELSSLIDGTIDDMDNRSDVISGDFDDINSTLDSIRDKSDLMLDEADRIINYDVDSVNEILSRISDLIDMLKPVTDTVSEAGDSLSDAFDKLSDAGILLADSGSSLDSGVEKIFDSTGDFSAAITEIQNASSSLGDALDSLQEGLGDPERMKEAIEAIEDDIYIIKFAAVSICDNGSSLLSIIDRYVHASDIQDAAKQIRTALDTIDSASTKLSTDLDELTEVLGRINDVLEQMAEDTENYQTYIDQLYDMLSNGDAEKLFNSTEAVLSDISDLFEGMSSLSNGIYKITSSDSTSRFESQLESLSKSIRSDLDYISEYVDTDVVQSDLDIDALYDVITYLKNSTESLNSSGDYAKAALDTVNSAWDYLDDAAAAAIAAAYCASDACDYAEDAANKLTDASDEIGYIIDYFDVKPDVSFIGADSGFLDSRDNLTDTLESLTEDLDVLNSSANATVDILSDDLRAINDKCAEIEDIIVEIVEEAEDTSLDPEDYTEDISESDKSGFAQGKVFSCTNYGTVDGDVNAGGIAGAMGVENSFDPEDDAAEAIGERSAKFTYMLRTIVRDSVNYGKVTAKKDKAGGVVGDMSTGSVIGCGGYGDVSSTSGDYVGGIAGSSSSKITSCSAMCRLSGGNYVGGIAGYGRDIVDCRSFCETDESDEYSGAVAGQVDGELSGNYFVENGTGAVDGVSYHGKAFPVTYEKMVSIKDIPDEFKSMKLVFMADDEIVATLECAYGGDIDENDIPEIPQKDGSFAKWEDFEKTNIRFSQVINADYHDLYTAASSEDKTDEGLPIFLVLGEYNDSDRITAVKDGDAWNVTLPNGSGSHTVRWFCGDDAAKTDVYVNGQLAESAVEGQYLEFTTDLSEFTLTSAPKPMNFTPFIIAAAAVAAVILLIIIVRIHKKNKKKKQPEQSDTDEQETANS